MKTATLEEKDSTKTQTCTSAVLNAPKEMVMDESPLPQPGPEEIRIQLEGSGICASNIPVWEGREWFHYPLPPGAPGHEGWGIVDKIGENVENIEVGDRVAALSYRAYATHDIAKAGHSVKLPEFLNGKPFPGEPLGCAMNIFSRSDIQKGQTVAIVGCGFLGLLLVQLAKSAGAKTIAISKRKFSLEMATEYGADEIIEMNDHEKTIKKTKNLTNGNFCERVVEATGKEWPLNLSIELTAERGKLIVAGFHQDGMRNVNMQLLNWRGIDMVNAHERDPAEYIKGMKKAISAIEENQMNPFPLFTHRFSLNEMETAFQYLTERPNGFIKGLMINA